MRINLEMLVLSPSRRGEAANIVRLSLFHKDEPIHLSDVMPMLENFGLRVVGETPYSVKTSDGAVLIGSWISLC